MKLKILDLFSGLGGFSLGLERTGHFETVAFCDNDKYSNLLLQKHWKGVKIYNDVKEITKEKLIADGIQFPDVITGGFPCQPFSVAGKQAGTDDDRHLWPVMFRIIQELTPRWVIGENVKGLTNIQDGVVFETVCSNLEGEGYEVRTFNIPAAGVGAPHRRERLWIVAHRKESMVNTDDVRLEQHNETKEEPSWWRTSTTFEPTSSRMVVNTDSDGSSTTTIGGSVEKTSNDDQEGQNKTRESERTSGRERDENMEDSRRTLQQGTELRETNEDEIREGYANQHQRSSSTSEFNVANTNINGAKRNQPEDRQGSRTQQSSEDVANTISRDVEAGRERQWGIRKESQGQGTSSDVTSSGETVANAKGERTRENDEGLRSRTSGVSGRQGTSGTEEDVANTESSIGNDNEAVTRDGESSTQEVFGDGSSVRGESTWWHTEPDVGRVAHGVPGRVYRLKGLGNSIIPQIAEEIGRAIIKAEKE